ncbi:hypothetical protein [Actinokineospora sp. NBRC 105648]|uniref:hypothetical protein n=1 Tax=Actinokineospora sp. NBRC 105648 TaxID=3032206 RepID=UPI0025521A96|nr:hypothetical protein [Actinokineospora sp. NBRC 105648]
MTAVATGTSGTVFQCCICGANPEPPDYIAIRLTVPESDVYFQDLGAHPDCLQSVVAVGVPIEIHKVL